MHAISWQAPQQLDIEDRPLPEAGAGELLIKVESVGVCGTDLTVWRGDNERITPGTIMGHEFGGTIVELGPGATGWSVGQRIAVDPNVVCGNCRECATGSRGLCPKRRLMGIDVDGGLQSFVSITPDHAILVPGEPDPRSLALIEPLAVGVHACTRAGVVAGAAVGIVGGGAIGMACALQALALGADSITVVEPDPVRRATANEFGVTVIAPGEAPAHRWDVAIDTVGSSATIAAALDLMEPGSTVCVVGLAHDDSMPAAANLVRRELRLTGSFCYTTDDLQTAANLVARHGLTSLPVDVVNGFGEAPTVIHACARGELGRGKTVFVLDSDRECNRAVS